ncbi:hypothetical protein L1049_025689 [Liquidambar formosana]|uniref:Proteoglycan 4-like n=1 Tax=Liquidambar formosana TaxID=63359 RepID=A0AAP0NBR2_LIQFO
MAEQRQPFRFRLPWLPAPRSSAPTQAPRPTVETQARRPTVETQAPTQPTTTTIPTQRPTVGTQAPTQPTTTTIPTQRPPFRPAGIAPTQPPPPPQAQAPPRTESQPSSPVRGATESRVTSQPASPSPRATETRVTSQPESPSRATTESRVTSQPSSPSRAAPQSRASSLPPSPSRAAPQTRPASLPQFPSRTVSQPQPALQTAPQPRSPSRLAPQPAGRTSSQPSSPSQTTSQLQPTAGLVPQPPSPPKKLQPTTQESSQQTPSPTQPPSSVSEREEQKPALSQLESQEPQSKIETTSEIVSNSQKEPQSKIETASEIISDSHKQPQSKTEITSEIVSNSQKQTPIETTSQPDGAATQPSYASGPVAVAAPTSKADPEAPAPPQISDSSTIKTGPKPLPESERKSEETKERKEIVQENREEEKINGPASEEPIQRTITELLTGALGSKIQTKEQPIVTFQKEQKQQEKQEVPERKETLTASGSHEKQFKTVFSTPRMDRNNVSQSHQKPGTFTGERANLHKGIREDISKFVHKMGTGDPKQLMSGKPASVITLAGENRGATMHLGSESGKKEVSVHIRRGYKINPDESAEATTDGEGSSKGRSSKNSMTKENLATKAYVNSNTQSINNSILFNGSVTERNPGVQLALSGNPTEPINSNGETESLETRKAEFNITPAEKLTYEPTVRRRCLRGLFLESSDSDPDNPEKPRRHGCRYSCGEKREDKEIGVL